MPIIDKSADATPKSPSAPASPKSPSLLDQYGPFFSTSTSFKKLMATTFKGVRTKKTP